jgi:hypothetical protein
LAQGELAVNLADEALYTKDASNAVVKLNAPSIDDKNTGATKHVTIDAPGNVGIGTSSPTDTAGYGRAVDASGTNGAAFYARKGTSTTDVTAFGHFNSDTYIENRAAGTIQFRVNSTERARIDSSGNLLVARTSDSDLAVGTTISNAGWIRCTQEATKSIFTKLNNTGDFIEFRYATGGTAAVGSISTNGTTTSYNTTSDYRLKHDIQPMQNALATVALLKPVTYKWNADNSQSQGFIAHELQEVVPECVTGEKDAVDADGNPKYQGIDTSFLVATLSAALQEAHGLIKDLQARVDALEAV